MIVVSVSVPKRSILLCMFHTHDIDKRCQKSATPLSVYTLQTSTDVTVTLSDTAQVTGSVHCTGFSAYSLLQVCQSNTVTLLYAPT